uniref:Uncharacterized protein n=1 Tax=Enterovibrio norvegicus TaxID=188144 RepID=A0A0H3ZWD0_9GAMM|nr:hypothetical protein [Enterovibrio norvegicus]
MTNRYGVPLLKYLVKQPLYCENGYTLPTLSHDLLFIARRAGLTEKRALPTETIYFWVRGARVPYWAQYAALELAIRRGWTIADFDDLLCVCSIIKPQLESLSTDSIKSLLTSKGLVIPTPLEPDLFLIFDKLIRDVD